jgi:predicted secreted protein
MRFTDAASAVAVYLVVWWICLFLVLPWGITRQSDAGAVATGTDPGAPARVHGWRIISITTIVSLGVTIPVYFYWGAIMNYLAQI